MLATSDTAGHESSLGDDNRDNVEEDNVRRHEAPYTEGMTSAPDNGFGWEVCILLDHFTKLLLLKMVVSAGFYLQLNLPKQNRQ